MTLGYLICFIQLKVGVLKMEGGMVEYFPVEMHVMDFVMILGMTIIIGLAAAYFPSKLLIKKMV